MKQNRIKEEKVIITLGILLCTEEMENERPFINEFSTFGSIEPKPNIRKKEEYKLKKLSICYFERVVHYNQSFLVIKIGVKKS